MAWTVDWRVIVGGTDMTNPMRPYLISVEVVDRDGVDSDACSLTFDDSDGQVKLPAPRTPVEVMLNGVPVFSGFVDSTPWTLSRGGGRLLQVSCKAFDTRGKATENQLWHLDDTTFDKAAQKAGAAAGFSVQVDPVLASIMRDYWSPDGASFIAWGEKISRELGATFKLQGNRAVFAKRGQGLSVAGSALPTVFARCGRDGNVISVNIDPTKGRPRSKTKKVRFFDREEAKFKEKELTIDLEDAGDAIDTQRWNAADEDQAGTMAESQKVDAERNAGVGSAQLDLATEAMAEGTLVLTGARPGIDGTYRITGRTHAADRDGGAVTRCELAQPQGAAGKDDR
ncbi:phage late control D family protein [Tianweitania sediminis]|uniref:Late control D family protein n=1 Tax=Tianweitania sediminis TaxID=1502156 RepID=A0A8J7QZT5_9HYPH|nr:late control D family protein [Tianweitania sediminis]MBP0438392.1 late control D family protein [Tianweitania sediminis]